MEFGKQNPAPEVTRADRFIFQITFDLRKGKGKEKEREDEKVYCKGYW